LQLQHSSLIRTVARKKVTVSRIVCHDTCIQPSSSSSYHFATPLRASTRYGSDRPIQSHRVVLLYGCGSIRWIQVRVRNVSYAYAIFRKIRTCTLTYSVLAYAYPRAMLMTCLHYDTIEQSMQLGSVTTAEPLFYRSDFS